MSENKGKLETDATEEKKEQEEPDIFEGIDAKRLFRMWLRGAIFLAIVCFIILYFDLVPPLID
ncbi:hypothetical protein GGQ84_000800 [Desulfitispora alkaliphila]|uniref:hypothetical protein n=1 Tax=Desulfitispora alkaliphila TaxID=622674 RepID=UPI003D230054